MKKIYLGSYKSCGIHNEKDMIKLCVLKSSKYEITGDYREADLIVIIDTCMSTYDNILLSIDYIDKILRNKKEDTPVIVSGCLTRGTKFELSDNQKNILNQVICVKLDEIVLYVARDMDIEITDELLDDFKLPFSFTPNRISVSPTSGCLNHCSFCKSNYIDFSLKSVPYENLVRMANNIDNFDEKGFPLRYISISSSNLSLYGVDLYKKRMSHEAIKLLTSPESIKFAEVGALINWYPELIDEIINNHKVKSIFTSLESGSDRIYKLMNRPISLDKLKEIIKLIRTSRPDILINTEFIAGYPTETIDDLKRSIDVIYELDINPQFIHPYHNSHCIPSSKLPQHSYDYCVSCMEYAKDRLIPLRNKYIDFVENGEMLVLDSDEDIGVYGVMLINGNIRDVRIDRFDKRYNTDEIIPANKIKCRQLSKRTSD